MREIVFSPPVTVCPTCGSRLRSYRTDRRTVKSVDVGEYVAVHRIMRCPREGTLFRSDILPSIISPHCIYSNEVMIMASRDRFIDGRSCSEISSMMNNGISVSHVRNLSSMALEIFAEIHEESYEKLRYAMKSYILQIDGTTDSEFEMIVVVRDSISGFTLYAEKTHSEFTENIRAILLKVRERFGMPSGALSDMRSGILQALSEVFPGIPVRICLLHFLRDLGKDILESDLSPLILDTFSAFQ